MSSIAVIFDHRIKKFLQTRKRVRKEVEFSSGRVYTAHQSTVFFIRWACPTCDYIKTEPTNCDFIAQVHRLCVLASGTSAFVIFSCFAFINVCLWHLGQNKGKFFNSVSSRICTLVLLPQIGHSINFSFCIRHISSDSQTQDCLSYCCQGKPQVPFALLLGL